MKRTLAASSCAVVILTLVSGLRGRAEIKPDLVVPTRSSLPLPSEAKALLNATHRHGEWARIPTNTGAVLSAIDYPDRPDKAPVVIVTATDERMTDWLRAVADQVAAEGFIAVVPDVTADRQGALESIRSYATRHPAANGRSATLVLDGRDGRVRAVVGSRSTAPGSWSETIAFLNASTGNDASHVVAMPVHGHTDHIGAAPQRAAQQGERGQPGGGRAGGGRGYPAGKLPNLPAGLFTAKAAVLHSSLKGEWVDIPTAGVYSGKMHTRITYPDGQGKAGIVVVMQHGPGMDDWMRALGDQLSRDGFITLVPDLHTGMGPGGGNYDAFEGPDGAFAANARLNPPATLAAYKAVREYGMKLARANGKSASLGFCMGGTNSWIFATEVPDVNAAVVYYGTAPDEAALTRIKAPVIGFFGEDDARITATVDATAATMKRLGKTFEPHVYPHATHGFLEFQDLGGNPAATADSWARTIVFLKQQLQ
jgi:carboxymethylenebutenolidase